MSHSPRAPIRRPFRPRLDLPPPFRAIALREAVNAFAQAMAQANREGAGALFHVGRFDFAEFAVVIEPDEPLCIARRAVYAGCVALAQALNALAPPEKPIALGWPDAVRIDGARVGRVRLGWPAAAAEDAPPAWLVFGATVRIMAMRQEEPGSSPGFSALADEGFEEVSAERLVESFARQLMRVDHAWREEGFGAVATSYLHWLAADVMAGSGGRCQIADNGDLLRHRTGSPEPERLRLADALAVPSGATL